ncbi:hypothetical protein AGMMS50267_16240 [Spirochaetia bacterium]|nr:hypothetical protein AGMMS50267_16240 [Spirochaetia bacterium]
MKKHGVVAGISGKAVAALALAFVLIACPNDTTDSVPVDTWKDVTSLSQLNGTWTGSYSKTLSVKELLETIGDLDPSMENPLDDPLTAMMLAGIDVTSSTELTTTIDAGLAIQVVSIKTKATFTGGYTALLWPVLKLNLMGLGQEGVTFDDATYSVITTQDLGALPIDLSMLAGAQINQTGTKVKIPEATMKALLGDGFPEIIFYKQ